MNYHNFDLEAFDYRAEGGAAGFSVRVASSPAGDQPIHRAVRVSLPPDIRKRVAQLDRRELDLSGMIGFGRLLGDLLFPPDARGMFHRSLAGIGEGGLRVRLRLDTIALADLPWEYAWVPRVDASPDFETRDGFLALNRLVSLARYEVMGQPVGTLTPVQGAPLRLVGALANPATPEFAPLNLDAERRQIAAGLAGTPVQPDFIEHANVDSMQDALLRPAHLFHFAGHGAFKPQMGATLGSVEGKGAIVLEKAEGGAALFDADKLALMLHGRGIRLAVLGACQGGRRDGVNPWTGVAPALARAGIPAVIGMQFSVLDSNATAFSRAFYRALAAGQPIDAAVIEGRLAIMLRAREDERDWGVPVLYMRASEGVLFPPAAAESRAPAVPAAPPVAANAGAAAADSSRPLPDKVALRQFMAQQFSTDDLALLCSDISGMVGMTVDLETVGGGTKPMMVLNLIGYLDRRGYYAQLVEAVRRQRPGMV
jgi:hypothetical protein